MSKIFVFAAGGTGGHIFPAVAIADEIKKIDAGSKIVFIGAIGRIEEKLIPGAGYELRTINISGFSRRINFKNLKNIFKVTRAVKESGKILKDIKPNLVFGTGGFVSGPVLYAASKKKIPTAVEEGNVYPGVTVKLLSKRVDRVFVNFEETKKYLKRKDNIEKMSYPVRTRLKRINRKDALSSFGLSENKKTLLIFGGSQGASSINENVLNLVKSDLAKGIQFIWQTGNDDYNRISNEVKEFENIKVLNFIDKMDYAYSSADLVLCRAGISTVMEIAYFGLPAIFVPYPFSSENHQQKNAKLLVDVNAAVMIEDNEIEDKMESTVYNLLNDETKLSEISRNVKSFAEPDAAKKIAMKLIEMSDLVL